MKYRNLQIPEGINVSRVNPLWEFVVLAGGALLLIILLAFALGQFGGHLARLLPFEYETHMAPDALLNSDAGAELQSYVERVAARVIDQMDLPSEMTVHLHIDGSDTFNAFATLGGNILLYRGLLEALPHENALAMLLAHEIAHLVHRDPIVGIGRGAAVQLVFSLLFGDPNLAVLGSAGLYTQLHFSRGMEVEADAAALAAVHGVYGHVAGASALFDVIQAKREATGVAEAPAIFSSHPLDQQRLTTMSKIAGDRGWSQSGDVTPLPAAFPQWMQQAADNAESRQQSQPPLTLSSSPQQHPHQD